MNDECSIKAKGMRFLRELTECTTEDKLRNESIGNKLQIHPIKDKLDETRIRWREHIARLDHHIQSVYGPTALCWTLAAFSVS
jgi:hypothetical protein